MIYFNTFYHIFNVESQLKLNKIYCLGSHIHQVDSKSGVNSKKKLIKQKIKLKSVQKQTMRNENLCFKNPVSFGSNIHHPSRPLCKHFQSVKH